MDQEKKQAKPPLNLLANILNNSLTSSTKYDQQKAGLETRTCGGCGAARPDGTDLSTCDFCGFEFYKKP
ncbi:hypothetical protein [Paraflavitalea sp. CAU 1676]|uniref:hypothetical protein n=1 Tax=Paraflavitalea sp. CAU 1676 TaxID=3032598 RepID=UPI0023DBE045|nr:hypothetical protein [Paraflavitalea sp. CAU 1676]MDF2191088.1 hypothetical protein [Paraflavitalea sp. CAU 1676]